MTLNPEKVVDVVSLELRMAALPALGQLLLARIKSVAARPEMDAATFVRWFADHYAFPNSYLKTRDFLNEIYYQLNEKARAFVVSAEILQQQHRILIVEATDTAIGIRKWLQDKGESCAIPVENMTFTLLEYPPDNAEDFYTLLSNQTGAYLHNLSLDDWATIWRAVQARPELASRLKIMLSNINYQQVRPDVHELILKLIACGASIEYKGSEFPLSRYGLRLFGITEE